MAGWRWIIDTNAGLALRISLGVGMFAGLAGWDVYRNGRRATRWREYVFLMAVVLCAMIYGAVNDQVTSAVSWEYFYYGKELAPVLGPHTPPDQAAMRWEAARIGMEATWTVGLLLGAAILIANNPRRGLPQVPYARLMLLVPMVILFAAGMAVVLGVAGWFGLLNWCGEDFRQIAAMDMWRPRHFMACWGAHLGGYIGGLLGGVWAVYQVWRWRKRSQNLTAISTSG